MKKYLITDEIDLNNISTAVKLHILLQYLKKGLPFDAFSDRELSILSELYIFGGVSSNKNFEEFLEHCKKLNISTEAKGVQTIRNTFSKARSYQLVKRPKANNWFIHPDILPKVVINTTDILTLEYKVKNGENTPGNNK